MDSPVASSWKTVDVTAPGDYPLSTESLWRSSIRVQGVDQRVSSGRFRFTRFEIKDSRGRAVGAVEFSAANSSGACTFDVEVKGQNRDRLGQSSQPVFGLSWRCRRLPIRFARVVTPA